MPVWTNIPGQFGTWRSRASSFPRWGVSLLLLAALPGILIAAVGAIFLGISLFAILLLVIPMYRLITLFTGRPQQGGGSSDFQDATPSPGSKPVTVRILE